MTRHLLPAARTARLPRSVTQMSRALAPEGNLILRWLLASLLTTALAAWGQSAPAPQPSKPRDAAVVKDFEQRVSRYMDLRKKLAGTSPKPTSSTEKLEVTRDQMAQRIRALRSGARQGAIFTPAITRYFRRQIATSLAGAQGAKILSSLKHSEPLQGKLKVNERYPQGLPLQSTPPSLLLNLPQLPKELEYRIVGTQLVLHDTAPDIVVDYIPHAIPQPQ